MWILALLLGLVSGFITGFFIALSCDSNGVKRIISENAASGNALHFWGRHFKIIEINGLQGEDIGGPK